MKRLSVILWVVLMSGCGQDACEEMNDLSMRYIQIGDDCNALRTQQQMVYQGCFYQWGLPVPPDYFDSAIDDACGNDDTPWTPNPGGVTCTKEIYVIGTPRSDRFDYNYRIKPCRSVSVNIYLLGPTGNVVKTIEWGRQLSDPAALSGSGSERAGASQICVQIDNGSPCCSASGKVNCE